MKNKRIIAVIPARYASSRLPGKPLEDICGKPMVVRVWERASASPLPDETLVATDDERIMAVCRKHSIPAVMTPSGLPSGSDRVYRALEGMDYDIAVNVQGDEPLLDPECISRLVEPLLHGPESCAAATLAAPVRDLSVFQNPNAVKVVCGGQGRALYFSRSPLPFAADGVPAAARLHIGLYAYTRDALSRFVGLPPSPLELQERLEQLRLLEAGIPVYVSTVEMHSPGVDTVDDLERVRRDFPG